MHMFCAREIRQIYNKLGYDVESILITVIEIAGQVPAIIMLVPSYVLRHSRKLSGD